MDSKAQLPCVIQALPALPQTPTKSPAQTPPKRRPKPRTKPKPTLQTPPPTAASATPPPSPRRTRSREAPEWTTAETLALVNEVAAVDEGWTRSVSSFQKWRIVADNLAAAAGGGRRRPGGRSASQCKQRWEALAAEYGAIRRWEMRGGGGGGGGLYWKLDAAARRKARLPVVFDEEVYGAMDAVIQVEESRVGGVVVVDGDARGEEEEEEEGSVGGCEEEEVEVDAGDGNLGCEEETESEPKRSSNSAWDLATMLQENAQQIQTILRGEVEEDGEQNHVLAHSALPNIDAETALARQKADELIKSLGGLVSTLNQFTDLIKDNGFERVISMN